MDFKPFDLITHFQYSENAIALLVMQTTNKKASPILSETASVQFLQAALSLLFGRTMLNFSQEWEQQTQKVLRKNGSTRDTVYLIGFHTYENEADLLPFQIAAEKDGTLKYLLATEEPWNQAESQCQVERIWEKTCKM